MFGISRPMMLVCLIAALNCASVGYDSSMMSSLNISEQFKARFGIVDANTKGLLTAVQNLGAIVGSLFAGHIVDRFGRKGGILTASCIVLIATVLHSTATTKAQFFVARIVVGFAKAIDIASVPTYLVELAPPKRRGFVAGLYWTCWLLGAIISSSVGYGARQAGGDWTWRIVCICMAAPALSCIFSLFLVPESPRWLISRGREGEALAVLARFHGKGDETHELVVAEFREIRETIAFEKENSFPTLGAWWKAFLSDKANIRRGFILITLGMFEQTVGSNIITFYLDDVLALAGITSDSSEFAINLSQYCVAFVIALVGICLVDKLGRIPMLVGGTVYSAVILACMAGLSAAAIGSVSGRNAIIAMVYLFQIGYAISWTPLSFSYCAELLNFTIRAKGMAFYTIFNNLVGFFCQYVIPLGLSGLGWR
ncbi:MFS general substrate transporter [Hypoxylon fragiforme]|uniref:MFS general substrate transporter n=1 Tax=Hypoxylon fragiforme TaxID=63214 RepID=UPI0020C646A6|nr:MFS general substrate transporter [Hypoxylon fragiforme]KAI2608596.1 MFS general substrate transporter [Hypoxylon fragiforme]